MTSIKVIRDLLRGGDRAEELVVPVNLTRTSFDDTRRTRPLRRPRSTTIYHDASNGCIVRLLKEVLRDSVRLQECAREGLPQNFKAAARAVIVSNKLATIGSAAARKRTKDATGLEKLMYDQSIDDLCIDIAGADDLSPLLRDCGHRIGGLCEKLTAMRPSSPEARRRELSVKEAAKVVARPPDEARGVSNSRIDRLSDIYLEQNLKYKPLEELSEAIDKASSYADLRKLFPERYKHHPNVSLLNNHALRDPEHFRRCINATQTPAEPSVTTSTGTLTLVGVPTRSQSSAGRFVGAAKVKNVPGNILAGRTAKQELAKALHGAGQASGIHTRSTPHF